jgi:type IV pilus assembly protein PilN
MIRINLLPFRAARKRENIKRQLFVYASVIIFCVLVGVYFYFDKSGELRDLKEEETQLNKDLATYKRTLAKIKTLEKNIKEINAKLDVIKKLERGKTGPVFLLEEISLAVPKDKLWLSSLSEKRGTLSLIGTAMDNETVALFMNNLEASDHIGAVNLINVQLRDLPSYKLKVSDFNLSCTIIEKPKKEEK